MRLQKSIRRRKVSRSAFEDLFIRTFAVSFLAMIAYTQGGIASAQSPPDVALSEDLTVSRHFLAVHGRRAVLQGYATEGLELWAYPFQIFTNYRVAFRPSGATNAIDGASVLSRVVYEADSITRIYLGPNFVAREKLFVPMDRAGAIVTYSIQSESPVEIEVHATPVMDLMWPAAVGGQSFEWTPSLNAFILAEPANGFTAAIGSPQIVAHDSPDNRTEHRDIQSGLSFNLHPTRSGIAKVFVTLNPVQSVDPGLLYHELMRDSESLQLEAVAHYRDVREKLLQVETPDDRVNKAIAWAEIALDQAWVCNPDLGCGYVAGYGPSRGARRPQYEWFFAGDGMVAGDAAVSAGDRTHAHDELTFILRYQDSTTGMIWHELSQSASFIDWTGKYPYMYVHVDITFEFLRAVERYIVASGDIAFLREHWQAIENAYRYCLSTIDPSTALPRIPAGKEGGDEQDRMSDALGLSSSWVAAAAAFSHLAALGGHAELAAESIRAGQYAREAVPARYWDGSQEFWIAGHTLEGRPMAERSSGATEALTLHLFGARQNMLLINQLASASFQTDWGTRSIAAGSAGFDPSSYGKGSVWTIGTAQMAEAFWMEHRPITALALWRCMLPLASLDSPGHMPEVLAGDYYLPQIESVPEQTWSSAGFLHATIHGLLGIDEESLANTLVFAPRLPPEWRDLSIQRIPLSAASISLAMHRDDSGIRLEIDNPGPTFKLQFQPDVPLGASLRSATFNRHPIGASIENHAQQLEVKVILDAPHGTSELELDLQGGVSIIPDVPELRSGDASSAVHIVGVSLDRGRLSITADVPADRPSHLHLKTAWKIGAVDGATAQTAAPGIIDLNFSATQHASAPYRRAIAAIEIVP